VTQPPGTRPVPPLAKPGAERPRDGSLPQASAVRQAKSLPAGVRILWSAGIVAVIVLIWQYGPEWGPTAGHVRFLNRFDISSPRLVIEKIGNLFSGSNGAPLIWPYLGRTVESTLLGVIIGMALGVLTGVALAELPRVSQVLSPFIMLVNSTPRVALIPLVVLLVGPTESSAVVSSLLVVYFLAFYNAYEGARSVPPEVVENAHVMGASRLKMVWHIRLPQSASWCFAVLPNVISFSLVSVVTCELLVGLPGMGQLILSATSELDASLTLAVVVILSVVGVGLIGLSTLARRAVLRWEVTNFRG
jgi:NitT/TauT family transport system permease protein